MSNNLDDGYGWAEVEVRRLAHENFLIAGITITIALLGGGVAWLGWNSFDPEHIFLLFPIIFCSFALLYAIQGVSFLVRLRKALDSTGDDRINTVTKGLIQ